MLNLTLFATNISNKCGCFLKKIGVFHYKLGVFHYKPSIFGGPTPDIFPWCFVGLGGAWSSTTLARDSSHRSRRKRLGSGDFHPLEIWKIICILTDDDKKISWFVVLSGLSLPCCAGLFFSMSFEKDVAFESQGGNPFFYEETRYFHLLGIMVSTKTKHRGTQMEAAKPTLHWVGQSLRNGNLSLFFFEIDRWGVFL